LAASAAGCGNQASKGKTFDYKTPLCQITYSDRWIVQEYPGQFLDLRNAYTFALLTYSPIELKNPYDDFEIPYGFTIGTFYYAKTKLGDFQSANLAPMTNNDQLKLTKVNEFKISGVKCRWEEAEIKTPQAHNLILRVDIPLDFGYIELNGWGPIEDTQLADDFRELARSLVITAPNHFKDHPEIGKKVTP
jgi:hypothetical protein